MKNKIRKSKKFVSDHRVAIAVALTLVVTGTMHVKQVNEMNAFLERHNLLNEYYLPEAE